VLIARRVPRTDSPPGIAAAAPWSVVCGRSASGEKPSPNGVQRGCEGCASARGMDGNAAGPSLGPPGEHSFRVDRLTFRPTPSGGAGSPQLPDFRPFSGLEESTPGASPVNRPRARKTRRKRARPRGLLGPRSRRGRPRLVGARAVRPGGERAAEVLRGPCQFVRRPAARWRGFDAGVGNTATAAGDGTRTAARRQAGLSGEHRCHDWEKSGLLARHPAHFCVDAPTPARPRGAAPGPVRTPFRGRPPRRRPHWGDSSSITVTPSGGSKWNSAASGPVFARTSANATVVRFPNRSVTVLAATRPVSGSTSSASRS